MRDLEWGGGKVLFEYPVGILDEWCRERMTLIENHDPFGRKVSSGILPWSLIDRPDNQQSSSNVFLPPPPPPSIFVDRLHYTASSVCVCVCVCMCVCVRVRACMCVWKAVRWR
jgi:hypothetical protein